LSENLKLKISNMKQYAKLFFVAVLGGMTTLLVAQWMTGAPQSERSPSSMPVFQVAGNVAAYSSTDNVDFTEASRLSLDAVVHVKTTFQPKQIYNPWSQFFGGEPYYSQQQKAAGSGVIISGDGYIVTNNHVIDNAAEIEITTNDNRNFKAKLIGTDPSTDLALLKIEATEMPSIILGDSDHLQVGEWVLAVGNPFNLTSTVTAGIVSAKARNINILGYDPSKETFPLESFIQTDAAVNPGNSGGALVNKRGELVGINTAIASRTGSYSGYSFAIPVSIVQKVTADLLEFGKVQRAYIGVNISNLEPSVVLENKLSITEGAFVTGLLDGGAAASAGLQSGDVITAIDDRKVKNVTELQEQIGRHRPGDVINIQVLRDNRSKQFDVALRDRYGNVGIEKPALTESNSVYGAKFKSLNEEEKQSLNIANGVKINEITDGKLLQAGLKKGFVITHIDKQPVENPEQVYQLLRAKTGGVLIEGVHQNGVPDYYGLGL
jgi:Do/DeqQ family serine protease